MINDQLDSISLWSRQLPWPAHTHTHEYQNNIFRPEFGPVEAAARHADLISLSSFVERLHYDLFSYVSSFNSHMFIAHSAIASYILIAFVRECRCVLRCAVRIYSLRKSETVTVAAELVHR